MNIHTALRVAGPGAHIVSRPTGVAHIYTGHLTPSGRFVPRAHRTVCRVHARRLTVVDPSLVDGHERRLCARCSGCLSGNDRHPEPLNYNQIRAKYAHLTPSDVARELAAATTPTEVDEAALIALALFRNVGCNAPLPDDPGVNLNQLIYRARARLDPSHGGLGTRDRLDELAPIVDATRRARAKELHEARTASRMYVQPK